ncbi:Flp family type IVb pilin [Sphingomonas sp. Leaf208]|jgi:pilus assembly protein Flp/PilA|uniref:Flp family type IVb pilin n=1 Tax=unclassified Sphingomonas TaxID=196159 RepID=UPI0006F6F296|nr:Flp family type IVb pilin [Sphingomonas sp. Leaf208]KQM51102.1 pilus assembly protein [Sphingomonas sp. Leaf208]
MSPISVATHAVIRTIARVLRERRGATAIEYGLIIALVVIAMIAGLTALADTTTGMWGNVNSKVANAR